MNGTNYEVPHCGAFSTPYSHPSWAQIFASGSWILFSNTLSLHSCLNVRDHVSHPYSTTGNYMVRHLVYITIEMDRNISICFTFCVNSYLLRVLSHESGRSVKTALSITDVVTCWQNQFRSVHKLLLGLANIILISFFHPTITSYIGHFALFSILYH